MLHSLKAQGQAMAQQADAMLAALGATEPDDEVRCPKCGEAEEIEDTSAFEGQGEERKRKQRWTCLKCGVSFERQEESDG